MNIKQLSICIAINTCTTYIFPMNPPLHDAAFRGDLKKVQELLANGTPVDELNTYGRTALHCAAVRYKTEVAKALLQAGANPDIRDGDEQLTPLHIAASWGDYEFVRTLLQAGAKPNVKNAKEQTALHCAACCTLAIRKQDDIQKVVGALLQAHANVNAKDYLLRTPLLFALEHNYHNIARILQNAGAFEDPKRQEKLYDLDLYEIARRSMQVMPEKFRVRSIWDNHSTAPDL